MELWTLINKETKEFIRFNKIYVDDEISIQHYFYYNEKYNKYYPMWITDDFSKFERIFKYVPECESMDWKTPCTDKININDWEIFKIS